jgi:hypothetical protein
VGWWWWLPNTVGRRRGHHHSLTHSLTHAHTLRCNAAEAAGLVAQPLLQLQQLRSCTAARVVLLCTTTSSAGWCACLSSSRPESRHEALAAACPSKLHVAVAAALPAVAIHAAVRAAQSGAHCCSRRTHKLSAGIAAGQQLGQVQQRAWWGEDVDVMRGGAMFREWCYYCQVLLLPGVIIARWRHDISEVCHERCAACPLDNAEAYMATTCLLSRTHVYTHTRVCTSFVH